MSSIFKLTPAAMVMAVCGATALCAGAAAAQPANLGAIHLSDDIVPAPDGFEALAGKRMTRKATDLYISPFI